MRKTGKNAYYKAIIPLFAAKEKNVFRKKGRITGCEAESPAGGKMPAAHKTRPAGQKVLRQGGFFGTALGGLQDAHSDDGGDAAQLLA